MNLSFGEITFLINLLQQSSDNMASMVGMSNEDRAKVLNVMGESGMGEDLKSASPEINSAAYEWYKNANDLLHKLKSDIGAKVENFIGVLFPYNCVHPSDIKLEAATEEQLIAKRKWIVDFLSSEKSINSCSEVIGDTFVWGLKRTSSTPPRISVYESKNFTIHNFYLNEVKDDANIIDV